MLVAAAVCPCPPLLVPEVASGAAPELDPLRAACDQAVSALTALHPDLVVVVGTDERPGHHVYGHGSPGDFRAFGVDLAVRLGRAGSDSGGRSPSVSQLPPTAAVGAWLLERNGWSGRCEAHCLNVDEPTGDCLTAGRAVAVTAARVALLVMGDGSACRSVKAPGYLDDRAEAFDSSAAAALGAADTAALAALDSALAAELKARGRAPWQFLAGAAADAGLHGRLLHEEAPYGVGYFVACWT